MYDAEHPWRKNRWQSFLDSMESCLLWTVLVLCWKQRYLLNYQETTFFLDACSIVQVKKYQKLYLIMYIFSCSVFLLKMLHQDEQNRLEILFLLSIGKTCILDYFFCTKHNSYWSLYIYVFVCVCVPFFFQWLLTVAYRTSSGSSSSINKYKSKPEH